MAKRTTNPLEYTTTRQALPIAKKPVFGLKIALGVTLGYRRNKGAGVWVVRISDGKGGNRLESVGTADDRQVADGVDVLSYFQARDRALARTPDRGNRSPVSQVPATPVATLGAAVEAYAADLQARQGDGNNVSRLRLHLPEAMLSKRIDQITPAELSAWRNALAKKLSPATVNRIATGLRAALNLASAHDDRVSDRAWRTGLKNFRGANKSRNTHLNEGQIRSIVAAAYSQTAEFGLLVEVCAVTGARISQIARLQVQNLHFQPPKLSVPASKKGRGVKKNAYCSVPIAESLATKLRDHAAGRAPGAPLLVKPCGKPWSRSDQTYPFRVAVKAAGLDPSVTLYALRHSSIVRMILKGMPIRVVAVLHNTSVAMIESNYSVHIADHADDIARNAMLSI